MAAAAMHASSTTNTSARSGVGREDASMRFTAASSTVSSPCLASAASAFASLACAALFGSDVAPEEMSLQAVLMAAESSGSRSPTGFRSPQGTMDDGEKGDEGKGPVKWLRRVVRVSGATPRAVVARLLP